jgi:hypothetical protein
MSCSCDNPAKVWDRSTQAARKTYACEECHHPIAKGETYARVGALHDGGWQTLRFCLFCDALAREALSAGFCYEEVGALYPDLLGWLNDGVYKQTPNGFMAVDTLYREGDAALLRDLHGAEVRER